MINCKVLEALEEINKLIIDELRKSTGSFPSEKDNLREARAKVQEAITAILKGS